MSIFVVGDIHAEWGHLNSLINERNPEIILQCGDFGFWPNYYPMRIKNGDCRIYWCDGNHEDHWALKDLTNNEVAPNVFYMKRGSTLTLPDGRIVLFMGGADSIDKGYRTMGIDWFPEEVISWSDVKDLPEIKIDIVISHTCPLQFNVDDVRHKHEKLEDPSRHGLSYILNKYKPDLWYFGHWHYWRKGKFENCEWTRLSMPGRTGWWEKLGEKR
jgi:hypothetical protein